MLAKTLPKVRITGFAFAYKVFAKRYSHRAFSVCTFLPIFLAKGIHFFLFFGQCGKRRWEGRKDGRSEKVLQH